MVADIIVAVGISTVAVASSRVAVGTATVGVAASEAVGGTGVAEAGITVTGVGTEGEVALKAVVGKVVTCGELSPPQLTSSVLVIKTSKRTDIPGR